jgi:hypothetical protein
MTIKARPARIVAQEKLSLILEVIREDIEKANPNLDGFDNDNLAENLLDLKNCAEPDDDDVISLAKLVKEGKFDMWACPTCDDGTMVYEIRLDADEWGDFQAASGTQDFASYPGLGHGDKRCDHCRCHMVGEGFYKP